MDKSSENWHTLPLILKCWFMFNFLARRPSRLAATRVKFVSHICGFLFCALGLVSEAALIGGLILLLNTYLYHWLVLQGDKYGVWYDEC